MKKLISAALVLATVLSFAGCSSSKKETLKVATSPDFAPMEFVDSSKKGQESYVGFDITLAKYIAEGLGKELEIVPMSFDACMVAVEAGSVDMGISGFSWTADRANNYNFSDYYYAGDNEAEQTIVTTKANEGKFTSAADFSGKKVAAQTGSLQFSLCKEQLPADCEVVEVGDLTTAFLQLQNGDFDAIAVAMGQAKVFISNNEETTALSGFSFEVDPATVGNVIMMQKGADELTAKVNELLAKAQADGLYEKWYSDALELSGVDTATEVIYDDFGNVASESESAEG